MRVYEDIWIFDLDVYMFICLKLFEIRNIGWEKF